MNKKTFWTFVLGSLLALSVWFLAIVLKYRQTKLVFCDVGQGNGVLVTRGEFQLLYDVGPDNGQMLNCLASEMPFWDKTIEVVVISHWDNDHCGGLAEIDDYYKINKLYSSKINEQISYSEILSLGDILRTSWMEFKVWWSSQSGDDNYGSIVGLLDLVDQKVLLMGDVPAEIEQRLVWRQEIDKKVDIVLLAHHGSKTSSSDELLEYLSRSNSDIKAIISVGKNSFGHPSKEVIDRLLKYGIGIRRTDEEGGIVYVLGM